MILHFFKTTFKALSSVCFSMCKICKFWLIVQVTLDVVRSTDSIKMFGEMVWYSYKYNLWKTFHSQQYYHVRLYIFGHKIHIKVKSTKLIILYIYCCLWVEYKWELDTRVLAKNYTTSLWQLVLWILADCTELFWPNKRKTMNIIKRYLNRIYNI